MHNGALKAFEFCGYVGNTQRAQTSKAIDWLIGFSQPSRSLWMIWHLHKVVIGLSCHLVVDHTTPFHKPLLATVVPFSLYHLGLESCLLVEIIFPGHIAKVGLNLGLAAVMRRPFWIGGMLGKEDKSRRFDILGLSSKESEYKWLGISHAAPRYRLFCQVPATSVLISNKSTLIFNSCLRRIAEQRPLKLLLYKKISLFSTDDPLLYHACIHTQFQ